MTNRKIMNRLCCSIMRRRFIRESGKRRLTEVFASMTKLKNLAMRTETKTKYFLLTALVFSEFAISVEAHHDRRIFRSVESTQSTMLPETQDASSVLVSDFIPNNQRDEATDSEFPDDLFTDEQLKQGAAFLHLIGAVYSFAMIGVICSNYFLPSVDCICLGLNLSQDVAAATFMSFATTAPELFTVLIATFITESDVGLGAVIGSGMFNILGVATFGGLAASKPIQLDWWPLMRDSTIYLLSLTALVAVTYNREVTAVGAASLLACYFVYFFLMACNQKCRKLVKACVSKFEKGKSKHQSLKVVNEINQQKVAPSIKISAEVPPVIFFEDQQQDQSPIKDEPDIGNFEDDTSYKAYFINYDRRSLSRKSIKSEKGSFTVRYEPEKKDSMIKPHLEVLAEDNHYEKSKEILTQNLDPEKPMEMEKVRQQLQETEEEEEFTGVNLTSKPEGSLWKVLLWLIMWPGSLLLYLTVPDCRIVRWRKYYPLTFIMCIFWIGITSYFGNWMITVLGSTIGIPDSVMGLTFLAAGGSMPEAFSIIIIARQGEGGLGFSNSLGGNTMDICLCLGLPWLLKCSLSGPIIFESESLQYNSMALFIGIFILVGVSAYTRFNMNRKMGVICCVFYLIFIVVSVLFELHLIPS